MILEEVNRVLDMLFFLLVLKVIRNDFLVVFSLKRFVVLVLKLIKSNGFYSMGFCS